MKLLARTKDFATGAKWSDWEECEDTVGLTEEECKELIHEWSDLPSLQIVNDTASWATPYEFEEIKIVHDKFDVECYNKIMNGTYLKNGK